ncbi:hypothetical protein GOV12_04710 [Candidatus Pacearchaeota archaeon]|nr:hypothetical protein [Candidatus Pacearchaeota archaeon]
MVKGFETHNFSNKGLKKFKSKSLFFQYLRYLVFIITITNLVFIGTVAIHEFGHFITSKYYDCETSKIIYEEDMPYTEALCKDSKNQIIFLLSGVLFPIVLAILLFGIGGIFIRDISILIFGFNLIASFRDFRELGLSDNIVVMLLIGGVILLFIGIVLLAKSRVEEYSIFAA